MKAKIYWIAWTFTGGWPRLKFHAHWKRNEHDEAVRHICVMGFGYSFEFRFGPHHTLSEELRKIGRDFSLEVCLDAADALEHLDLA